MIGSYLHDALAEQAIQSVSEAPLIASPKHHSTPFDITSRPFSRPPATDPGLWPGGPAERATKQYGAGPNRG
jgi:hypothetical protein